MRVSCAALPLSPPLHAAVSTALLVLVGLGGLSPARAFAQDDLWARGVALRDAGRDAEALEVFEDAHRQTGSARTLVQVALAEQALARWGAAGAHLARALQTPDEWINRNRPAIDAARAEIARHTGQLEVLVDRAGATVEVEGRVVGTSPLPGPVIVTAGAVPLRVRGPDGATVERSATVQVGALSRESVSLVGAP